MRWSTPVCLSVLFALVFSLSPSVYGQGRHEQDRVTGVVDGYQKHGLAGHLPRWVTAQNDQGRLASDVQLNNLVVVLTRSNETQAAFEQLLDDQTTPGSANFHQWLTP